MEDSKEISNALTQPIVIYDEIDDDDLMKSLDEIEDGDLIDIITDIPKNKIGESKQETKKTAEEQEIEDLEKEMAGL